MSTVKAHKNYPNSVYGYADWLYVRRNVIVHGEGSQYDEAVKKRFKDQHRVGLTNCTALSIAFIRPAITFYQDFCAEFLTCLENTFSRDFR